MPKFDDKASPDDQKPICKSTTYLDPDALFIHNQQAPSAHCRILGAKGLVEVCPALKWGKTPEGKPIPPLCTEQIVIVFAFNNPETGDMELGECYFQKGGFKSGKNLMAALTNQVKDNLPIYFYPVQLSVVDAGIGNVPGATLVTSAKPEFSEEDHQGFKLAIDRYVSALEYLKRRAAWVPKDENETQEVSATASAQSESLTITKPVDLPGKGVDFEKALKNRQAATAKLAQKAQAAQVEEPLI